MAYQIGSIAKEVLNVGNSFTKLFGLDFSKYLKGKKYDWTNAQQAISKAFQDIEIKNAKQLNDLTKKMEDLLGLPGGSNLRKVINQAKQSFQKQYNSIQAKAAGVELAKTRATNLANDLANADFGDWLLDENTRDKKKELNALVQTADPQGNHKQVPGWENNYTDYGYDEVAKTVEKTI